MIILSLSIALESSVWFGIWRKIATFLLLLGAKVIVQRTLTPAQLSVGGGGHRTSLQTLIDKVAMKKLKKVRAKEVDEEGISG